MIYNDIYNDYMGCDFKYFYPFLFHDNKGYLDSNIQKIVEIPFGDTYQVFIPLNCYILINNNDIVYSQRGVAPKENTKAILWSRAYNIEELRSWQCIEIDSSGEEDKFIWEEDKEFKYFNGTIPVYLPNSYYNDKVIKLTIYNFRYEQLYETELVAEKEVTFNVSEEINNECFNKKGSYFCKVTMIDPLHSDIKTAMLPNDFVIVIK